jgi:lanosterol synthase
MTQTQRHIPIQKTAKPSLAANGELGEHDTDAGASGEPGLHYAIWQSAQKALGFLRSIQRQEGCVVGEVVWCPMLTAQYVMTAYMTGQRIPEQRRKNFLKYFRVWQNPDGGWGLHAESHSYVFVTTLVYVALRLLGQAHTESMCFRARTWLERNGGILAIPTWGKAWLAMMNLYDWKGVAAIVPELWLQPDGSPFHPRRMYCHTRLIYLGLSYLYGVKFQVPETELIDALRNELFTDPYKEIDFAAHRFDLTANDVFEAPHPLLKVAFETLQIYDAYHSNLLRQRALDRCLDHIVFHQRQSRYAAISPVNGLLNTLALFHAKHEDFLPSFEGVDYWVWKDETEGERFNGAHSHSWDTAFAVQAIAEGPLRDEKSATPFLKKAARFFDDAQMREEIPHRKRYYRDKRRGGFCFSDEHHRWPVSDCTAEALSALCHLAGSVELEDLPSPQRIVEAVHFVLTRQNDDGGWGSYERRRGGMFLERFNPSEMFGNCMVEHSYVECTASCIQALRHFLECFSHLCSKTLRKRVLQAITRGARLLRVNQLPEGAWPGFWGVNYTYGTLFGVIGLLASGCAKTDPAVVKACRWLLDVRLPDGGWGESFRGCVEERYIPSERSQVIQTSWALMTLLKADYDGSGARQAIEAALSLIVGRQLDDGDWPKEGVGGVFFNTAMHHYCLYKNTFTLWALNLYLKRDENAFQQSDT